MAEAYTFIDPGGNKRFCFFPCGLNLEITSSYYYFEATNPLVRGDIGYEVIDVRIRGLVILCLDLRTDYNLVPPSIHLFQPIYVLTKTHFLNASIRFREGQSYIYAIEDIWRKGNDKTGKYAS
jgi:hypothetical protein